MSIIKKKFGILGGGIAGLSLAYFLKDKSAVIIEKNDALGGLCRSYNINGLAYDIGPHIMFSKNKAVLDLMTTITPTQQLERSNQIFLKGSYIKYPFENFLGMLKAKADIQYCLDKFLDNPYQNQPATNMLTFFLKTFGEGITELYLRPYNEKIWKFDPALMDTQMVERIPQPPKEDIVNAAAGKYSEGYTHQLHFSYPVAGGYQSMVDAFSEKLSAQAVTIARGEPITKIESVAKNWLVTTSKNRYQFDQIINCLPIHEFIKVLAGVPDIIQQTVAAMKYNSIYIVIINVKKDLVGNHFAVMVPQPDVIFHRISKLDFLGSNYHLADSASFMAEVTFRSGDQYDQMPEAQLVSRCIDDMVKLGFIESKEMVNFTDCRREKYAYVIYDLSHRTNTDKVLSYLREQGIESNGRFAEFEYENSDKVIEKSMVLAQKINQ